MFEIQMTRQLLASLVRTVFGSQIAPHWGKYAEMLVKKFGAAKTSWEFYENTVFKLYLTVQVQIYHQFCTENLHSQDTKFDVFVCLQL